MFGLYLHCMTSYSELSDEELVKAIRLKEREWYGEIIRRYETKLTHYLRKFIRDHDELEDVLQEVFIKAYRNLFDFNTDRKFSPWIYRIAHNQALNQIKKYSKESFSIDEKEWEIIDEKMDLKKEVDRSIAKEQIEKALSQLKEKYREPLVLFFFEEKTYEEIADIIKAPTSSVGTLIARGKNQLKEYLKKQYGK